METKRKPSYNALTEGREPRKGDLDRLSNVDLISSSSLTTGDLFKASGAEVGEDENKKKMERTLGAFREATYLSKSMTAAKPVL